MSNPERMRVRFWGVRGSTPTPQIDNLGYGGNTPCLEVRLPGGEVFVFDAGTGARNLGTALMEENRGEEIRVSIFLTHFHWDHIQGIPFFAPLYEPNNHLQFISHASTGPLKEILGGQMAKPYFPVNFETATEHREFVQLDGKEWREGALRVQPFPLNHPQGAAGYRIEANGAVAVYATDHEHGVAAIDNGLREIAQGADLLIYDSQYTPAEYEKHRGWGHSTWKEAAGVARDGRVKQLVLFHHDPSHNDETMSRIAAEARCDFEATAAAREGMVVAL
jgi:phosphoribosyl 1,2-cyclic phosphodiesterase